MTISSAEEKKQPLGTVGRPALLVAALTVVMLLIAVSCGGGDDDGDDDSGPNRDDREVIMSTFTPTIEGDIPEIQKTSEARQTASAEAATEVAENPPPPTNTPDPDFTPPPGATPEPGEEGLRPPHVWLSDGTDQMEGVFGRFGFVDTATGTGAQVQAPFYDVGGNGLTVAPGTELEFILEDDVVSPSSMAVDPTELTVSIFTWEDNSAIPGDTEGNVEDHYFFVPNPESGPVSTNPMTLENPVFTMPAEPDRYVVQVDVVWPTGDEQANPQQDPIFTTYAFTVYVE